MSEELKVDPKQAVGQEAELAAQNMVEGTEKTPDVDVEADYQASKEYSVSDMDRSGAGSQAAKEATAPKQEMPEAKERRSVAEPTGNPEDYRKMAEEVNPRIKG